MTVKELRDTLLLCPDNFQVFISNPIWLDKKEDYWGIECKPITATRQDEKNNEIQLFSAQNIKEDFPDLSLLIQPTEET